MDSSESGVLGTATKLEMPQNKGDSTWRRHNQNQMRVNRFVAPQLYHKTLLKIKVGFQHLQFGPASCLENYE